MKDLIFRIVYGSIIVALLNVNAALYGYNTGWDEGYGVAMADIILKLNTPQAYFQNLIGK